MRASERMGMKRASLRRKWTIEIGKCIDLGLRK
jgi:hypothetical protein